MPSRKKLTIVQGFGLSQIELETLHDLTIDGVCLANDKVTIVVDEYDTVDIVRIHSKKNAK